MIENDKNKVFNELQNFNNDEANISSFLEELKKGSRPTSNIAPTATFIKNVVVGIGAKTALTATTSATATASSVAAGTITTTTTALVATSTATKLIVGSLITLALAGGIAYFSSSNGKLVSSLKGNKSEEAKKLVIETEVKELKESNSINLTPVLKFGSPSENVD